MKKQSFTDFKKILFLFTLLSSSLYGCGCTDAGVANSFKEQSINAFKNLDSNFAKKIKEVNEVLKSIAALSDTTNIAINTSIKGQQVNLDNIIFTVEQRQMINAIIQKNITNWEVE